MVTPRTLSNWPANEREAASSPGADERTATAPRASNGAAFARNASRWAGAHSAGGRVCAASAKPSGTSAPEANRRPSPTALPP